MRHAAETLDALGVPHDDPHRLGPPHARAALCLRQGRQGRRLQGDHRRRRRRRPSAGHDRGADRRCRCSACRWRSKALRGVDSLLSIVQMPAGIPVGTLAIGKAGAVNAALLAARGAGAVRPRPRRPPRRLARRARPRRWPRDRKLRMIIRDWLDPTRQQVSPGVTIGILGGGQLGAHAGARRRAARHSAATSIAAEPDSPAFEVARAPHHRRLRRRRRRWPRFAEAVDVVTYEFENIPAADGDLPRQRRPVLPGATALAITQDRLSEKRFVTGLGLATARVRAGRRRWPTSSRRSHAVGRPAILKTRRLGYDGKGQAAIRDGHRPRRGLAVDRRDAGHPEGVRAVRARGVGGRGARRSTARSRAFDLTENVHRDHILRHLDGAGATCRTTAAAQALRDRRQDRRRRSTTSACSRSSCSCCRRRAASRLLVNEIAPRVHNSGHWTHGRLHGLAVRAARPRGRAACRSATPRRLGSVEMTNLIGDEVEDWRALLAEPGAALHLYGKGEARPGRKMGHVTRLSAEERPARRR